LYVAAVLRTLAVYKPHPFRLTVDGEPHELRAWLVAVGNGPAYGGGMNIAPNARLDDGLLDITVVGEMSRLEMLWNFPKVFKGTHLANPKVTTFRGARAELESLDASVPMDVYADGERVGPLPATMDAVRDAINVRVP
jgi:diacylglycerol kinase (ATP)